MCVNLFSRGIPVLKIVIPVAGVGTRLRPHTFNQPKALIPIAGKPALGHILERLTRLKATNITLVTGYLADRIEKYAKEEYDGRISLVEQKTLLGIGYAVYLGIGATTDEDILVVLGDTIVETDWDRILTANTNTLAVRQVENPTEFGVAEVSGDRVTAVVEKPPSSESRLALVGVYLIKEPARYRECFEYIRENGIRTGGEFQITDVIGRMLETGSDFTAVEIDRWYDCGKPETLLETNRYLLSLNSAASPPDMVDCVTIPPVSLAHDSTYKRSVIGPHVSVGSGCTISNCILTDSIIANEVVLDKCILTSSIAGKNTRLTGTEKVINIGDDSEMTL